MDSKPFQYFLVQKETMIFLFESQFQFFNEHDCLRHYEKGIQKGLFTFDRSSVQQIWCELKLWGLIGRVNSAELVRILCAFGCHIEMKMGFDTLILAKSFYPVTYYIPVLEEELSRIRHYFHKPLVKNNDEHIPLLLELKDKLVLGHYFTTEELDADQQLPQFCSQLEKDMCFKTGIYQSMLATLFYEGLEICAKTQRLNIVLAKNDLKKNTLLGNQGEQTLFYVGQAKKAA